VPDRREQAKKILEENSDMKHLVADSRSIGSPFAAHAWPRLLVKI
jgi:hypothetical protein